MLSVSKLFEVAPPPQGVMDDARNYTLSRIAVLKQNFAMGRLKALDYQMQLKQLLKDKNNKLAGTFLQP